MILYLHPLKPSFLVYATLLHYFAAIINIVGQAFCDCLVSLAWLCIIYVNMRQDCAAVLWIPILVGRGGHVVEATALDEVIGTSQQSPSEATLRL